MGKLVWEESPGKLAMTPGNNGPQSWVHRYGGKGSLLVPTGIDLGLETYVLQAEVGAGRLLSLCPGNMPQAWPRAAKELRF